MREVKKSFSFSHHPFKARFFTGLFMILLAFIGLIVTEVKKDGGLDYWIVVSVLYVFSSLFLSWYLRHKEESHAVALIWHEIFHWFGLLLSVYLVTELVRIGMLNRFAASLVVVTLLGLSTFLAGVYIEKTFLLIGLLMGGIVVLIAFLTEYIYFFSIPLALVLIGLLFFFSRRR